MAITDFFDRGWDSNPTGTAFVVGDTRLTYTAFGELSCRIGHALLAADLPGGTKVAVLAGNDPAAWACVLGIWRAGLVFVPLNPHTPAEETQQLLRAFDCEVLLYQAALAPVVEQMRPALADVHLLVCIDTEDERPVVGSLPLLSWIGEHPATRPDITSGGDDVVTIAPTGGTTGRPKGVMNTHRSLGTAMAHLMISMPYAADERAVNLAAAPMTHSAGVLTLPCSARGGTVVVLTRPDPAGLATAIMQERVTELFLPPTVIYRLLEAPGLDQVDLSSLRYLMYGAAPMSVDKLRRALEVFGPIMTGGYGQTEAPLAISCLTPSEHFLDGQPAPPARLGSVGRPGPLIRVSIRDDDNNPVATGDPGEICVRGDLVMAGYYKDPEQTAAVLRDGWLHTGDIGHLDEHGYLTITDRKKDMIISGGFNIYPNPIEQVIWAHPAVQDCAVIGIPDPDWGEAVVAAVELAPDATVQPDELIALCKAQLGSIHAPKAIHFTTLPRSANGKVLKRELRTRYAKE
jgi:acyl-CoA synthetase (AMP-forming)/AMP-acid ligase II